MKASDEASRLLRIGIFAAVVASALGGCGGERGEAAPDDRPARIVTLAPNLTEIAFELGLGDRVVGVSDFTAWPPAAADLPRLGGLFDPNLERMVALEPDLAIVLPSQDEVARRLAGVGVPSLTVGIETLDDLEAAARAIAERCGVAEAGEELAQRLSRELAPRPVEGAPPTVVVLDREAGASGGLLVAGPGTFYQELLERLGSSNVFADAPLRYPVVGMEEVLGRAPRLVIEIRSGPQVGTREERVDARTPDEREDLLAHWRRYPSLPATATGDVYRIDATWAVVLGPRTPRLYAAMEEAVRKAAKAP